MIPTAACPSPARLVALRAAALELRTTRYHLRGLISAGALAAVDRGGQVYVDRDSLDALKLNLLAGAGACRGMPGCRSQVMTVGRMPS
jgi:hypothetical protein